MKIEGSQQSWYLRMGTATLNAYVRCKDDAKCWLLIWPRFSSVANTVNFFRQSSLASCCPKWSVSTPHQCSIHWCSPMSRVCVKNSSMFVQDCLNCIDWLMSVMKMIKLVPQTQVVPTDGTSHCNIQAGHVISILMYPTLNARCSAGQRSSLLRRLRRAFCLGLTLCLWQKAFDTSSSCLVATDRCHKWFHCRTQRLTSCSRSHSSLSKYD